MTTRSSKVSAETRMDWLEKMIRSNDQSKMKKVARENVTRIKLVMHTLIKRRSVFLSERNPPWMMTHHHQCNAMLRHQHLVMIFAQMKTKLVHPLMWDTLQKRKLNRSPFVWPPYIAISTWASLFGTLQPIPYKTLSVKKLRNSNLIGTQVKIQV